MEIDTMREAGVEWVEWLCAGTGDECPICMAKDGKVFRLGECPPCPCEECQHEDGCRCVLIAVADPNE